MPHRAATAFLAIARRFAGDKGARTSSRPADAETVVVRPKAGPRESWWVGLSRTELAAEAAQRVMVTKPHGLMVNTRGVLSPD